MTINSLSPIQSTPFCGLGTQTYNVLTTGLYTVSVNVTIPWMTSDQPQARANPPTAQIQDVTCVADTGGSLNDKYWTFYGAGNNAGFYVWYNINAAGTDPAIAGLTGIEVAGATGVTAADVGLATRTAIAANAAAAAVVSVSGATTHVILTNKQLGECTAAANAAGGDSAGFSYSVTTTGTYGYASGLTVVVANNAVEVLRLSNPAPTQPLMAGSVQVAGVAGQAITVVTSSLSDADLGLNAVKGIINIYQGE